MEIEVVVNGYSEVKTSVLEAVQGVLLQAVTVSRLVAVVEMVTKPV